MTWFCYENISALGLCLRAQMASSEAASSVSKVMKTHLSSSELGPHRVARTVSTAATNRHRSLPVRIDRCARDLLQAMEAIHSSNSEVLEEATRVNGP